MTHVPSSRARTHTVMFTHTYVNITCIIYVCMCICTVMYRAATQASANAIEAQDEKVLKKMEEHVVAEDVAEKALPSSALTEP